MYSALLSNILDFSYRSKVNNCHCVVEQCLRHGVNPRTQPLFEEEADIIQLKDGLLAFIALIEVSLSMKTQYQKATTTALTKDFCLLHMNVNVTQQRKSCKG